MNFLPYAYPIEVFTVIVAALGILVHLWAVWDARVDTEYLKKANVNGDRHLRAMNNLRTEVHKLCVVILLLAAGIASVHLPPPLSYTERDVRIQELIKEAHRIDPRIMQESRQQQTSITINRITSILIVLIMVGDSILARHNRMQFVRHVHMDGSRAKAQQAANIAQVAAGLSQEAATESQKAATVAQDVATSIASEEGSNDPECSNT